MEKTEQTQSVITFAVAAYLFKEWIVKNTTTLENRDTELTHRRRPSRVNRSILQDQERLRLRLEQLSRELESRNTNNNTQQRRRSSFDMPSVSDDLFTVMSAPTGAQSPFAAWRDYQQQATGSSLSQTRTWRAREFTTTTHIAEREDYFGEQVARRQEERREQDVNDNEEENGNEDDNEDEEDQTFDLRENRDKILEAVGLHGSPFNLIKNPILMSLMINLCLGITIWIPYIIGKAVASAFPLNTLKNVAYQFTDIVYQMPLVKTISSHPSLSNYLSYDMYHLCSLLYQYISEHEKIRIALYVSTGYLILISIGFWYLHHNRTLVGRTVLRQQTVFFKVLLFILLELVLFPIVCGFFLDLSTLPFFKECSLMDRIEFVQHNPYSSIFLHWFVGTGFIYKFSVFISHVREVVRPGVLWFIRDPSDPQFHPVQEMVEQPILSLFKRFMSNAATYFMLIMVGMGLVSLLICRYTSIPPIVWTFSTPLSTLPFDLLAIQFILPRVMEYIVPGEFSKRAVMTWWHIVAKPLRLSSFMFGEIGPETPTNGHLAQVPAYDHVPYVRHRSMVVPVDPQSLAPLDETDRLLGHPAGSGVGQTMIVYIPPFFKIRVAVFLLLVWITGSILVCSMSFVPCCMLDLYVFIPIKLSGIQVDAIDLYIFQDWAIGVASMTLVSGLVGIFSHSTFRSAWIDMEWHVVDLSKASKKVFIPIIALLVYVNVIPSLLTFSIIYVFAIDDPWVRSV
ncbi:hypothetical protein G6F46_003822 [Rhizopus delemar]|uniref:RING-type E3 ubiquitin transferase n=2 Tax=Rhizopus TaxID=4842 RepID=A0A9P6Z3E7_9FUNG|nr:hypothetical protein G6F55_008206 [Rhizopus delemar]KAG1549553.1 hypothetical protein G6F51_002986 [Rhizopus arrhizus]KAG1504310.1 hypothetical protein G6F54_001097 [Rhizopus delemar]KAG1516345.1 hypothetical protein G6F53_002233 [Rhizopus delemar]KAG1522497.1 hypothetical protein G6F52_005806 [Rhizopus delemar]